VTLNVHTNITLNNTTTVSDCQTPIGQITGDKPEQGIHGYGRKFVHALYRFVMRETGISGKLDAQQHNQTG